MNILITRAKDESLRMALEFEKLGHFAIIDPLITIIPISNWFENYQLLKQNIDLIVFTSKYAIREFASKEKHRAMDILVVGKKSFIEAKKYNFINIEAANGNVESLIAKILSEKKTRKILYLSGNKLSLELDEILIKKGLNCKKLQLYQTSYTAKLKDNTVSLLLDQKVDIIIIYSRQTAITFKENIEKLTRKIDFSQVKLFVLSFKIANELKIFNWNEVLIYNNNKLLTEYDIISVIDGGLKGE